MSTPPLQSPSQPPAQAQSQPLQRIYLVFTLNITPQSVQKLLTACAGWANQGIKKIYLMFASLGGNAAAGTPNALFRLVPSDLVAMTGGRVIKIGFPLNRPSA